jgi:hypothetical protein
MTKGELESATRRAYNRLDVWLDCTGFITPGTSYYYELQSLIEDAVHCGAQAATGDYKRLEDEEGPIPGAPGSGAGT